jgi:hypothetical protein
MMATVGLEPLSSRAHLGVPLGGVTKAIDLTPPSLAFAYLATYTSIPSLFASYPSVNIIIREEHSITKYICAGANAARASTVDTHITPPPHVTGRASLQALPTNQGASTITQATKLDLALSLKA